MMAGIMALIQIAIFMLFLKRNPTSKWMIFMLTNLQFVYFIVLFGLVKMLVREKNDLVEQYIHDKKQKIQIENQNVLKEINENVQQLKRSIQSDSDAFDEQWDVNQIKHKLDEAISKYKWAYETKVCENKVVDAILLNKMTIAKEKNIPMYVQVVLPVELPIVDLDVVSLFSNLIDNAIEANEKLEEKERFISVTSGVFVNVMYISVENTKLTSQFVEIGSGQTSKKDKKLHGYGTKIIKRIIEQYDGHMQVIPTSDRMKIQLYINL